MEPIYYYSVFLTVITACLADRTLFNNGFSNNLSQETALILKPRRIFVVLLAIYLIIVGGFRYNTGTDYGYYYNSIKVYFSDLPSYFGIFKEPGIRVISAFARLVYDDGISIILLCELITVTIYIIMIYKYSPIFSISMILYVLMGEWTGAFNGVRQYLAAAILFAGHRFILERKFWKYLFIVFLASLFHVTAWVMLVPYFIFRRTPNIKQLLLLAAAAIAVSYSYDLLFSAIGYYKGQEMGIGDYSYYGSSVNILRIAVAVVPVAVYFLFCKQDTHAPEDDFYINGLLFNAFAMVAASGSTYLARIGIYSAPVALIGYAYLFRLFKKPRLATIVAVLTVVFFSVYWWYTAKDLGYTWWFSRTIE